MPEMEQIHENSDDILHVELQTKFAGTEIPNSDGTSSTVWTRAYASGPIVDLTNPGPQLLDVAIPADTLVYDPGSLLHIKFYNLLDAENSPEVGDFDKEVKPNKNSDEIVMLLNHELNLPHNANNTNLHVHGLHVDPSIDDVTLVITPDDDELIYNPDVSDRPVQNQFWDYHYRIPETHLPGTHWFHAHKHGSTALQVENGMAGAMIIRNPNPLLKKDNGEPFDQDWDEVLVLQGITNYQDQPGAGGSQNTVHHSQMITINGEVNPVYELPRNQVVRWRLINATANHLSFSYFWLGQKLPDGTWKPTPMQVMAVDGITLPELVTVSADGTSPMLMLAPGNRADVLVQLDSPVGTEYGLFKNIPAGVTLAGVSMSSEYVQRLQEGPKVNPLLFNDVDKGISTAPAKVGQRFSIGGVTAWKPVVGGPLPLPVVPLLRIKEGAPDPNGNVFAEIDFETAPAAVGKTGYQPAPHPGGGKVTAQQVLTVKINSAVASTTKLPSAAELKQQSPVDNPDAPAYASPIEDGDILQSRAAVFDLSGAHIDYTVNVNNTPKTTNIRQFTLNGRQFDLDDSIGNPHSNEVIGESPSDLDKLPALLDLANGEKVLFEVGLSDVTNSWTNFDSWTNPGYYRPLTSDGDAIFYQAPTGPSVKPDLGDVTGLNAPAVVNTAYAGPVTPAPGTVPGLPVAQTAEEWVLINNSDIGHPFHIHINPFFITELGQLTYDQSAGQWDLNKIVYQGPGNANQIITPNKAKGSTLTSDYLSWMVGTWWDVVLIPPHGYVKFRYWMNVPKQSPLPGDDRTLTEEELQAITIEDNVNRYGAWVYHCHILRHEDRGMMMAVATQVSPTSLAGSWIDNDGYHATVVDAHGQLSFTTTSPVWWRQGTGTFGQGLGDPQEGKAFMGTQHLSNADGSRTQSLDFTVSRGGLEIVFSNGIRWGRTQEALTPAATPINLSGDWMDEHGHHVQITATDGALKVVSPSPGPWFTTGMGNWPQGVGDPFAGEPFTGTVMFHPTGHGDHGGPQPPAMVSLEFNATADGNSLVFANGDKWVRID